jgi:hypothetical protein
MEITAESIESSLHTLQPLFPKEIKYKGRTSTSLDLFYTDGSSKDSIYVIEIEKYGHFYIWTDGSVRSFYERADRYGTLLEDWLLKISKQSS